MRKESMTPKERWQAVLQRKSPDRIPMDYWGTEEATAKVKKYLGVSTDQEMDARLHIDRLLMVYPTYVGPALPKGLDMWGLRHQSVDYGTGAYAEVINHPLAKYETLADLKADYTFPTADLFDFSAIPKLIRGQEHRPVRGGGSEPFLMYKLLRGDELAYMDLILNPEIVHYCMEKMYALAYETTRRIYEAIPGKVLISYVAEDLGGQESLMYSPDHIKTYFIPHMKRMAELIHQNGSYVFHHNDGAVRDIIPTMIEEVGIDILNPIQWVCRGMEREGLKRDFGDKVIFHGAVDNQRILPFGTEAEVRQEVADNIATLGKGGGYIIAPCHNIQANSPAENVVALYAAGYELGWT